MLKTTKIAALSLLFMLPLFVGAGGVDPTPSTFEFAIIQNGGTVYDKLISQLSVVRLRDGNPYLRFYDGVARAFVTLPLCEEMDRPECVSAAGVTLNESHPGH